ncbi:ABC transporter permease [Mycoplasma marinum]|uniref:ABC transporter permease n=1 Tax=Mycoplasma marinum TaxID=1937190 RepID=UPI003B354D02
MTSKEFNIRYNLSEINEKWFSADDGIKKEEIQVAGKPSTVAKDIFKRFFSSKTNIVFLLIVLTIILLSIIVPHVSRYHETEAISGSKTTDIKLLKPTWQGTQTNVLFLSPQEWNNGNNKFVTNPVSHEWIPSVGQWKIIVKNTSADGHNLILGTDSVGRDIWTRLWIGTAWSLKLAITAAVIETFIGVSIGVYIGFHIGKALDTIVMRFIEIFTSVPSLLWLILLTTIAGTGFGSILLALVIVGWAGPVWSARMFTIKVKDQDFILAAEATGVSKAGRIYKHILPNILGRLLVSFVLRIPSVIFFEVTLIFLGLSVGGAESATLGRLINLSRAYIFVQPFYILGPTIVILLLTVSLQILANGMRDAFDPKITG